MPSNSSFALPTQHASQESEQSSLVCPPFPNSYLQTLSTSVPYFSNAALNALLAIVTSFANLLVLLAMRRITSIRLPSKLLLCSLVLTDLGAGLVAQPLFASYVFIQGIDPLLVPCWLLEWHGLISVLFFVVSLLTSAAISLDRYVALFHSLNYQRLVTSTRVSAIILVTWSIRILRIDVDVEQCAMGRGWNRLSAGQLADLFRGLRQDLPALTIAQSPPSSPEPRGRPAGGKRTKYGEVSSNGLRHDVGVCVGRRLLFAFLRRGRYHGNHRPHRPHGLHPGIHIHVAAPELLFGPLRLLLARAGNSQRRQEKAATVVQLNCNRLQNCWDFAKCRYLHQPRSRALGLFHLQARRSKPSLGTTIKDKSPWDSLKI